MVPSRMGSCNSSILHVEHNDKQGRLHMQRLFSTDGFVLAERSDLGGMAKLRIDHR
jgi:hypothetical protein